MISDPPTRSRKRYNVLDIVSESEQAGGSTMRCEKLLTVFEAERLTGRKASTWRRDIFEGRVARVKIGRLVRIPASEIERLVSEGYRPSVREAGQRRNVSTVSTGQ